jgi:hypothetical protein
MAVSIISRRKWSKSYTPLIRTLQPNAIPLLSGKFLMHWDNKILLNCPLSRKTTPLFITEGMAL